MVSIRAVALKAGVSIGTVSHVLNGNAQARISKATQERVRQVADSMGYRPNPLARSLWRGKTDTIGLLVSGLQNPFFVEVAEAAETAAIQAGYQVLMDASPSVGGTYQSHHPVRNWPVDAAIAWMNPDQTITSFVGVTGDLIPTVYLGYERTDETDWVAFDLRKGASDLASYLVDKGYRRIAYVSAYEWEKSRHEYRFQAYEKVLRKHGLEPTLFVTENEEETREAGLAVGLKIGAMNPADRPDALMCHNDILAIGVHCGLRRAGMKVPSDIAIAGFDGIPEGRFLELPLTTVRTDAALMIGQAMTILQERWESGYNSSPRGVLVPAHLTIGGTT